MPSIKVLFPSTDEEIQEANALYEEGKAASGLDRVLEDEDGEEEPEEPRTAEQPPRVAPSPFRQKYLNGYHTKDAGAPCAQGERSDLTNCVPASGAAKGGHRIDTSKLPKDPHFVSSQAANVAQNKAVVNELKQLAAKGDLNGLKNKEIPPSPKLQKYKQDLIKAVQAQLNSPTPKPAAQEPPTKPATPPPSKTPIKELGALLEAVAQATGHPPEEIKQALTGSVAPNQAKLAQVRADVAGHILSSGSAQQDAVLNVLAQHDAEAVKTLVGKITKGNVEAAQKEFAATPLFDLQVLSGMEVSHGKIHGEAVCYMADRKLAMGSTTRTGSYRHELGHAIRSAMAGISAYHKTELTKAIDKEYKQVMAKVKADPTGIKTKLDHDAYETKYGAVGRRALDNWEENFAEHYRLYHREIYKDKNEGGNGKWLAQYRQRHPGMAAIFDAWYTAALLGAQA
jgi:hypothetical protein